MKWKLSRFFFLVCIIYSDRTDCLLFFWFQFATKLGIEKKRKFPNTIWVIKLFIKIWFSHSRHIWCFVDKIPYFKLTLELNNTHATRLSIHPRSTLDYCGPDRIVKYSSETKSEICMCTCNWAYQKWNLSILQAHIILSCRSAMIERERESKCSINFDSL
jgi:hypothetical protein